MKNFNKLMLSLLGSLFFSMSVFATPFIIGVDTNNSGNALRYKEFTIPINPDYANEYNYSIDCEYPIGSNTAINQDGNYTCSYDEAGNYLVAISGDFPAIHFNRVGDEEKITSIESWGTIEWKSMQRAFRGAVNLEYMSGIPNLSNVTNMSRMFEFARVLSYAENINEWNVSNITDMTYTFYDAQLFNSDISAWDVSGVTSMTLMFYGATSFNQDIGTWNVGEVENMFSLFRNATSFNQDIGDWDVSKVSSFSYMFKGTTSFNQDIGDWDISGLVDSAKMNGMFGGHDISSDTVNLSVSNYDNLLLSWSKLNPPHGVSFDAGTSTYYSGAFAHYDLGNDNFWTFSDGGEDTSGFHITSAYNMSVKDGETVVGTVTLSTPIAEISFTLGDSGDSDKFDINGMTGELIFFLPPDANNPTDRNTDNIYRVQVIAIDDQEGTINDRMDVQTIRVKVESNSAIVPIINYLLN